MRVFSLALFALSAAIAAQEKYTLYIIRHGEKTSFRGCLDAQGKARAQNLIDVFNGESSEKHQTFEVLRDVLIPCLEINAEG